MGYGSRYRGGKRLRITGLLLLCRVAWRKLALVVSTRRSVAAFKASSKGCSNCHCRRIDWDTSPHGSMGCRQRDKSTGNRKSHHVLE